MTPPFKTLESLPLWKQFKKKAKPEELVLVTDLINHAIPLLDRIVDTFPTYTLHNNIHQLNVIRLMGALLGKSVAKLSTLESAFLILSAFYHDIGMVFDLDTKAELQNETDFPEFLEKNPEAHLEAYDKDPLPNDIAEWYCRWAHAKRVRIFLDQLAGDKVKGDRLKWGTMSLRQQLGDICESHNSDVEILQNDKFKIDFRTDTDLRFCAILLRLADIMDFDNTRTPESLYVFLKLKTGTTSRERKSDNEFRKHMNSEGFQFPQKKNRELKFIAGPDNPEIEHEIRTFLDVIENELQKCSRILKQCSTRWRDFVLPDKINRDNIISQNYQYGNFQFTLDKNQILNLLMGENLYNDPYVFIRELVQNAIDTSRHREFYERSRGNSAFVADGIELSTWTDSDGYRWVRIDDYGMGMDRKKIENYLLKVGNSFYNSPQFKIEKLGYSKSLDDFTPISRFGIGILSCFLVGDIVEINTKTIKNDKGVDQNIRLSLSGLQNFYVLQHEFDIPKLMVNKDNVEEGYRKKCGSSVAVRIDPKKESYEFDLRATLKNFISSGEIPVKYEGEIINENTSQLLQPICNYRKIRLDREQIELVDEFFNEEVGNKIQIELIPLDLTKNSVSKYLKGQFLIVHLVAPGKYSLQYGLPSIRLGWRSDDGKIFDIVVILKKSVIKENKSEERQQNFHIEIDDLREFLPLLSLPNNFALSHNGIKVPIQMDHWGSFRGIEYLELSSSVIDRESFRASRNSLLFGILALKDKLRPDVTASRNTLKKLSWNVYSTIALSFLRSFNQQPRAKNIPLQHLDVFGGAIHFTSLKLGDLMGDELLQSDHGWKNELLFNGSSINDLNKKLETNEFLEFSFLSNYSAGLYFTNPLIETLLDINFSIAIYFIDDRYNKKFLFRSRKHKPLAPNLKLFTPLFFVEYENSLFLKIQHLPFNANHPFSTWLISFADQLNEKFPGLFELICQLLSNANRSVRYSDEETPVMKIERINKTLTRISELKGSGISVPKEIFLTEKDFIMDN